MTDITSDINIHNTNAFVNATINLQLFWIILHISLSIDTLIEFVNVWNYQIGTRPQTRNVRLWNNQADSKYLL